MVCMRTQSVYPRISCRCGVGSLWLTAWRVWRVWLVCLVCLVCHGFTAVSRSTPAADSEPAVHRLPELIRTKHLIFSIPFRLPAKPSPDSAPQRVTLSVSKDQGGTWEQASEASPSAGSFTYRATADGEYWFRLRSVDAKGRTRGGEGPDMRVLVDAAGPHIAARVWKGTDGEIVCRYAAIDDSVRLDSLTFEYRGKGDASWKKIAAVGILARESPAHMVGEEIWWAGEKVEEMTVRIAISDSAGNKTTRNFSLEPTDPGIDQAALSKELGAMPLPTQEMPMHGQAPGVPASAQTSGLLGSQTAAPGIAATPGSWAAESATAWSSEASSGKSTLAPQSVLVKRVGSGDLSGFEPQIAAQDPKRPDILAGNGLQLPAGVAAQNPEADTDSAPAVASGIGPRSGRQSLEYRGKALQLVRSRRFAWDYEFQSDRPDTEPIRVELWSTRDGGVTWQCSAVDDDDKSPINIALPASGLYGFRLEVVPDIPDPEGGPRSGDMPDSWVGIDDEPPQVELIEVTRTKTGEPGGILLRYTSHDQLLVPRSGRLLYSPNMDGPWATIAESVETQGEYRWQPARSVPAKVFVRVEATDAAGNVGSATSGEKVSLSTSRVIGKLGGVRSLPPLAIPE